MACIFLLNSRGGTRSLDFVITTYSYPLLGVAKIVKHILQFFCHTKADFQKLCAKTVFMYWVFSLRLHIPAWLYIVRQWQWFAAISTNTADTKHTSIIGSIAACVLVCEGGAVKGSVVSCLIACIEGSHNLNMLTSVWTGSSKN